MESTFEKYISSNYHSIKQKCEIAYRRATGCDFNPDVFHDTLIKCSEKVIGMNDQEIENYIYISYKTNMFRENQYARNKYKSSLKEIPDIPFHYWNDFMEGREKLMNYLKTIFDDNAFEQFCEWIIENKSVREIEKAFGEKGLYKKFQKMKKKIIEFYGDDLYQPSDL